MNDFLLSQKRYTLDSIFRFVISIVVIALFFWLLAFLSDVLLPFVIAFVVAYLLHPIVNFIQRRIPNRALALLTTIIGFSLFCLALGILIVPIVATQMVHTWKILSQVVLESALPTMIQNLVPTNVLQIIQQYLQDEQIQTLLQTGDVFGAVKSIASVIYPRVFSTFTGIIGLISSLGIIVVTGIYTFFLLLDFEAEKNEWQALIPEQYRSFVLQFLHDVNVAINTYFRGQLVVSLCTGIMLTIGFLLIGVPLAIPLGMSIGLLNMVPYLALAGLVPTLFLQVVQAVGTQSSVSMAMLSVLAVFIVAQLLQDLVLTPKILGKSTGLSPVFILLALSIWGKLLGLLGLIIAIPITCVLLASYRQYIKSKKI